MKINTSCGEISISYPILRKGDYLKLLNRTYEIELRDTLRLILNGTNEYNKCISIRDIEAFYNREN